MLIDDEEPIPLRVQTVIRGDKSVFIRLETGKVMAFSLYSQVSGISHGNLEFATIEPNLFVFWLLEDSILHVACPYTQPYTPTLRVYLERCARGEINP